MNADEQASFIIATDVGGTCTDTVILQQGSPPVIGKSLSTPPDFADGVVASIGSALPQLGISVEELFRRTKLFIHGSTVAENTILTGTGAVTGLITTAGFEDTILVTRGPYGRWSGLSEDEIKRPIMTDRERPLVAPQHIVGITERIDYKGAVLTDLDRSEVERVVRFLVEKSGVSAIAISLLWSVRNSQHELAVKDIIRQIAPNLFSSLSSESSPAIGEYERTSTTVINAYAGQIVEKYLLDLERVLSSYGYQGPVLVMQGYGGLLPAGEAARRTVGMIESGPAAGVIAASFLGDAMGDRNVIAADMGGTTFKVSVVQDGRVEYAREPMVGRYHYTAPKMEVFSIGVAGGSIISIDPRTLVPAVGPRSAGARPGPVCYGFGGDEPTLTDVLLLIGYLDPKTFLGGSVPLDVERAHRKFREKIASPLSMQPEEAAIGIYKVAAAQITDLIHKITVERGLDPRDFVIHAFGGTCGMLAGAFAPELKVKRVVIPYTASVNCALGLVAADIVHEYSMTKSLSVPPDPSDLNTIFAPMADRARSELKSEGFSDDKIHFKWSIDVRYRRQVHEVTTPVNCQTPLDAAGVQQVIDDFQELYERIYGRGSSLRGADMEMTAFRLTARGLMTRPQLLKSTTVEGSSAHHAKTGKRPIFVQQRSALVESPVYDFLKLAPGNVIEGPAIILTPITTIAVQQEQTARIDEFRNVVLEF